MNSLQGVAPRRRRIATPAWPPTSAGKPETVLVIGAGPAGLAAAAERGRAGVPAVVLERADAIGAAGAVATTGFG